MSKGIRFFGTDYNENAFGGTPDASSRSDLALFAFDGLVGTRWSSDSESTDGDEVYLEMDYGIARTVDSFFVYNTNIEDIEIQYFDGADWITCSSGIATITKSTDKYHLFVSMNSSVTTQKVRIVGSNTITENQEKYVTLFHAFMELGQFEYFPDIEPKFSPKQDVFETTDGRAVIIERGEAFSGKIKFKSHVNQDDIDLAESLIARKSSFFIWPNGGDESIFSYSFRPYRFQDVIKVSIVGDTSPKLTNNYYKAGYNNTINMVEVT